MGDTIIAIDVGRYKSVACTYTRQLGAQRFRRSTFGIPNSNRFCATALRVRPNLAVRAALRDRGALTRYSLRQLLDG